MAFKANHNSARNGAWIGDTDIWNDPRANASYDHGYDDFAEQINEIEPRGFATPSIRNDPRPASPAQLKFLKDLFAQRSMNPEAKALRIGALSVYRAGRLSMIAASDFITVVKRIPRDS